MCGHLLYVSAVESGSALAMIRKHIEDLDSIDLSRDDNEREEMYKIIKEFYSLSFRYVEDIIWLNLKGIPVSWSY